jgi:hypothetical protein
VSLMTKMQVAARNDKVKAQALKVRGQARQQAGKAAAQVGPLASSAKANAGRGVLSARAWAAPRLESSGQALESRVAPKVSAMMSSAAKRIDPDPGKRRRWPLAVAGLLALAAAAVAAIFSRRGSGAPWRKAESQEETPADETKQDASANANGSAKSKVGTS